MNKFVILMTTLGVALAAPAWAHKRGDGDTKPIQERRPLKADARVVVRNVEGLIEVMAWDRKELELTGELGPDVEKLEITGNESSIRIEVKLPKGDHHVDGGTTLRLRLPAGVTLEAEAVSADVRVRDLKGPVTAESVSGDVRLDVQSAKVRASSVSGDVEVRAPAAEARVSSVSGDVTVRDVRGELRAESVSGDLDLSARELRSLEAETVSGDIELDCEPTGDADISVETLSGEVTVRLSAKPDGEVRVETFSGQIISPWWSVDDEKEYRGDGSGKGRLRLHSFSGDIVVIHKAVEKIERRKREVEVEKKR